jgi:hypothetical protein
MKKPKPPIERFVIAYAEKRFKELVGLALKTPPKPVKRPRPATPPSKPASKKKKRKKKAIKRR